MRTTSQSHYCEHLLHFWSKLQDHHFIKQEYQGLTLLKSPSKMYWSHYAWGTFTEENISYLKNFSDNLPFACFVFPEDMESQNILSKLGFKNEGYFPELICHSEQINSFPKYQLKRVTTEEDFKNWLEVVSVVYEIDYHDLYTFFNPPFLVNDSFFLVVDQENIVGTVLMHHHQNSVSLFCLSSLEKDQFYAVGESVLHHIQSDDLEYICVQTSYDLAEQFYFPFGFQKSSDIIVNII